MILSVSLLAAALSMQPAADWRPLAELESAHLAWNAANVTRQGDVTIVSVRVIPQPPRQGANAYAISRLELHCASNQARVASTQNFATDGTPGVVDNEMLPFEPIPAQSFVETVRGLVCPPRT
jgi:hypothetical protein